MKTIKILLLNIILLTSRYGISRDEFPDLKNYWQIGFGLGELPTGGSFKPSITLGYYFNEKVYAGIIYQFKDEISRNRSSFNAKSAELDGLLGASEKVAHRFLFHLRYTPINNGPYLSGGFVFNGKDKETMLFDDRVREFDEGSYQGTIDIVQTRPAGWGLAFGLGYQYNFKKGFSTEFEWTPAWGQYPDPSYVFGGTANLAEVSQEYLQKKMDNGFKSSVTNMYKVFHIGVAYRFQ